MKTTDWQKKLNALCGWDQRYQQSLAHLRELEEDYARLRSRLCRQDRETLDAYLSACEELDHIRTLLAYDLGAAGGLRGPETARE